MVADMQEQKTENEGQKPSEQIELATNTPEINHGPIIFSSEEEKPGKKALSKKFRTIIGIATGIVGAFVVLAISQSIIFLLFFSNSKSNDSNIGIGVLLMFVELFVFIGTSVGIAIVYIRYSDRYARLANALAAIIWIIAIVGISLFVVVAFRTLNELSVKNKLSFGIYTPSAATYGRNLYFIHTNIDHPKQYVEKVFEAAFYTKSGSFKVYEFPVSKEYNPPQDCGSYNAIKRAKENPCIQVGKNNDAPIYYANDGGYAVIYSVIGNTVITIQVDGSANAIPDLVTALKSMQKDTTFVH
jgi:hypothetical protein